MSQCKFVFREAIFVAAISLARQGFLVSCATDHQWAVEGKRKEEGRRANIARLGSAATLGKFDGNQVLSFHKVWH
jgi:hypothetical protein